MTYDSSVFSRGNYYKDSFYFKNTKGFRHIFTVNIPLHSKKTIPYCHKSVNSSGRQSRPLPGKVFTEGSLPQTGETPPNPVRKSKKSPPAKRVGRSFKKG